MKAYFRNYSEYHRTRGNRVCHSIGIPILMVSILGLLARLDLSPWIGLDLGRLGIPSLAYFRLDGGILLLLSAMIWYLLLAWKVAIPFFFFALGCYWVGRAASLPWLWGLFVLGWIFQLVGHAVFEQKAPAFTKNLQHVLIGPIWCFASWFGYEFEGSRRDA